MIVDFRNRPPTPHFLAYFNPERTIDIARRVGAKEQAPSYLTGSVELYWKEMAAAGITHAVVPGRSSPEIVMGLRFPAARIPNEHIAELQRKYPGKVIGFAGIDVTGSEHDPLTELERCLTDLGLKGIFVEPGRSFGTNVADRRLYPLYERCEQDRVPVMVMTGPYAGATIDATHPSAIDTVANDFPSLPIVCGHGCWPWVQEIVGVAFRHRNVFVSPDIYMFVPGSDVYVEAANGFMAEQFLFGTAYPLRPLEQTVRDFEHLGFQKTSLDMALFSNAARLLGLKSQ